MNENLTLYDVLDLKPDASQQEVREAYVRTKSAYNKDSLALYTLISTSEREDMLRQVEDAYEVLSNPEKRKEYDRCHGLMTSDAEFFSHQRPPNKKIISIDRVPPMEANPDSDRLLVAPSTDFEPSERATAQHEHSTGDAFAPGTGGGAAAAAAAMVSHIAPITNSDPVLAPTLVPSQPPQHSPVAPHNAMAAVMSEPQPPPPSSPLPAANSEQPPAAPVGIVQEIAQERDWPGPFLKRVRDFRRVSIEEMASITKVSKTYITAIENEDFKKLPAPVFVRGFIMQISRVLRLPAEQVATPYMARYNKSRGNT